MTDRLTIAKWSPDDQAREKLRDKGPQALSNAELLAILVGSGTTGVSAVELMQQVLGDCHNNLNTLGKRTIRELTAYKGVGEAKAITILAACELGKRRQQESPEERPELSFRLIRQVRIAHGGISEVSVDVRIIMREAVLSNATAIAVCHNHPSGSTQPSGPDNALTDRIRRACEVMRIRLMDHIILADGSYFSYHEAGRL